MWRPTARRIACSAAAIWLSSVAGMRMAGTRSGMYVRRKRDSFVRARRRGPDKSFEANVHSLQAFSVPPVRHKRTQSRREPASPKRTSSPSSHEGLYKHASRNHRGQPDFATHWSAQRLQGIHMLQDSETWSAPTATSAFASTSPCGESWFRKRGHSRRLRGRPYRACTHWPRCVGGWAMRMIRDSILSTTLSSAHTSGINTKWWGRLRRQTLYRSSVWRFWCTGSKEPSMCSI